MMSALTIAHEMAHKLVHFLNFGGACCSIFRGIGAALSIEHYFDKMFAKIELRTRYTQRYSENNQNYSIF